MKKLKSTRKSLLASGVERNLKLEQQLLELTGEKAEDLRRRFWWIANIKRKNDCWIWRDDFSQNRYGQFTFLKKKLRASRVSYILHYKKIIPSKMFVCHECDNKACVNPYHLWIGSNKDNQLDSVKKGKNYNPVGELAPSSKLKGSHVLEIRRLHAEGIVQRRLAEMFGVGYKAINKIVLRQRWKHI